ncbi:MAG: DUF2442 domain-containing protein [Candidatus Binataceae bacterium]
MSLLRIKSVAVLEGYKLRLTLTDGSTVERDISNLMVRPIFEALRLNPGLFAQVRVEGRTVVWPNDADLCPDVVIWGGPPPEDSDHEPVSPS